ncbi:MAG: hypothetical protein Q8L56_00185 [Rhodocyclaceae bacterium]|nr:hypothetical protein [Rhodocyclaceae bacterium]
MLVWLGSCAVTAFLAAAIAALAAVLPAPTFHIIFTAGAMPLICGAIIHFVPVLTRSSTPSRAIYYLPLPVQLAGIATPLGLAGILPVWSLHAAATTVSLAALALTVWIARRLRTTLGAPHPGARWYGAALLCLFFAVSLVPVWLAIPELRPALRLFHLHLNTLGFIGLAALGTLPVLLPTVLGRQDTDAANRLRRDLPVAAGGAVLVAAGATAAIWLAVLGALLLAWVAGRNLLAWQRVFGMRAIVGAGGTASLAVATAGFMLLLLAGIAHGMGWIAARPALAAYIALFLLPLVTGALSQLLPVWRYPGSDSPMRRAMSLRLARGGRLRAALFLAGGLLLALDFSVGILPVALGLALFALALCMSFWLDRAGASDDNSRPPS